MRTSGERYIPAPAKYIGKYVRTTSTEDIWKVEDAYAYNGVLRLLLTKDGEKDLTITDHEHATLLPYKYQGPGVEAVRNPQTREVYWEDE